MNQQLGEVLSAFLDGETVDADRLEAALSEPEALGFLVSAARVRAEVAGDTSRPGETFYERLRTDHAAAPPPRRSARWRNVVRWPLATAALVAAGLSGWWLAPSPVPRPLLLVPPALETSEPVPPAAPAAPEERAGATTRRAATDAARQLTPAPTPPPDRVLDLARDGEWREGPVRREGQRP